MKPKVAKIGALVHVFISVGWPSVAKSALESSVHRGSGLRVRVSGLGTPCSLSPLRLRLGFWRDLRIL